MRYKHVQIKPWVCSCIKKARYNTKELAEHVAQDILKSRGVHLHIYYCKYCCGYHLTKKVKV